jgi:hypothetical protein
MAGRLSLLVGAAIKTFFTAAAQGPLLAKRAFRKKKVGFTTWRKLFATRSNKAKLVQMRLTSGKL